MDHRRPAQGRRLPLRAALHDEGEKVVLGHRIKAAAASATASECSISSRAHPSTARFIATKLARRFVSDTPPAGARRSRRRAFTATRTATSGQ